MADLNQEFISGFFDGGREILNRMVQPPSAGSSRLGIAAGIRIPDKEADQRRSSMSGSREGWIILHPEIVLKQHDGRRRCHGRSGFFRQLVQLFHQAMIPFFPSMPGNIFLFTWLEGFAPLTRIRSLEPD
jgi:hypothetical protein